MSRSIFCARKSAGPLVESGIMVGVVSMFVLLALVVLVDVEMSRRVMMITDGWWEYYAWLVNSGFVAYKDFSLKFPPLFVYYTSVLAKMFGYEFLGLRLWADGVHALNVVLIYIWLRRYTDSLAAAVGTAVAAGLVMSNPVYLAKDYHTMVSLFVTSALVAGEYGLENFTDKRNGVVWLAFSGLMCGSLLLVKQNIGVFFSLGVFVYWFYVFHYQLRMQRSRLLGLMGVFLSMAIFPPVLLTGVEGPAWLSIFAGNDAKGSIISVLFRFLFDKVSLLIEIAAVLLVAGVYWLNSSNVQKWIYGKCDGFVFCHKVLLGVLSLLGLGLAYFSSLLLLPVALAWPFIRIIARDRLGVTHQRYGGNVFLLIALAYCGTQTAGYNYVSMEWLIGLLFAEIAGYIGFGRVLPGFVCVGLPSVYFMIAIAPKLIGVGYDWWGLKAGGLLEANKTSMPFQELSGMTTDPQTAKMFRLIADVRDKLKNEERVFSYPSIPIVYQLLKRKAVGAPVLWFDVAGGKDGKDTVVQLDSVRPEYIFWLRPSKAVYEGHFRLRRMDPAMLDVDDWLFRQVRNGVYVIVDSVSGYDPDAMFRTAGKSIKISGRLNDLFLLKKASIFSSCLDSGECNISFELPRDGFTAFNGEVNSSLFDGILSSSGILFNVDRPVFYVLRRMK